MAELTEPRKVHSMAFQFLCPQGHLLQGEESLSGTECRCPQCGVLFLIPQPPVAAPPVPEGSDADYGTPEEDAFPDFAQAVRGAARDKDPISRLQEEPPPDEEFESESDAQAGAEDPDAIIPAPGSGAVDMDDQESFLHIPCPAGHMLETPRNMLGQEVLCPFCKQRFYLQYERSVEYQQAKQLAEEKFEQRRGRIWMAWAVAAAVIAIAGIVGLILAIATS